MNVKDQLRNDLLKYPNTIKNKWGAYHQWFCVSGNKMAWVNGELVDTDSKHNIFSQQDAIENQFNLFQDEIEENIPQGKVYKYQIDKLKSNIMLISCVDGRMEDFSQCEDFFSIDQDSPICNVPRDIKDDWKEALNEFLVWIGDNQDKVDLNSRCILKNTFSYSFTI